MFICREFGKLADWGPPVTGRRVWLSVSNDEATEVAGEPMRALSKADAIPADRCEAFPGFLFFLTPPPTNLSFVFGLLQARVNKMLKMIHIGDDLPSIGQATDVTDTTCIEFLS